MSGLLPGWTRKDIEQLPIVLFSFLFLSFFFFLFFAATGRNANVTRKGRQYLRSRFNCLFARILRQRKRRIGCRNRIAWETKSLSLLTAGAPSNCFLQNICSEKPKLPRIFYSSRIRNMFGKLLRSAPNELGYRSVLWRTWIDKITISITYIFLNLSSQLKSSIPVRFLWGLRNMIDWAWVPCGAGVTDELSKSDSSTSTWVE